jgi:DNA-binding MarR family transcriptional regulator
MQRFEMDPDFVDCRGCVCSALRRASRVVTQHFERSFRGTGLRSTQFTLLALLTQTGPLPVSRLASMLGVERTTLTRNLRPLKERGLVSFGSVEGDERVHRIELTADGRAAARKGLAAWRRAQKGAGPILRRLNLENLLKAE